VSFAAIALCITSQRLFISLSTESGNFWIHPRRYSRNVHDVLNLQMYIYAVEVFFFFLHSFVEAGKSKVVVSFMAVLPWSSRIRVSMGTYTLE
jgi:hypothetical protein